MPTPIQMAAIPVALQGRDIIGIAKTGSGKTAAFLIPMIVYIQKLPKMTRESAGDGPYALIMAPTRELAQQIEEEAIKFCEPLGLRALSIVGGVPMDQQTIVLREGCEILIATPGRLKDSIAIQHIVLNQCNYCVMDEADKMIDMGFEAQVNEVLAAMPNSNLRPEDETLEEADVVYRQTIMFSATMPPELEKLARKYMRRPATVSIGGLNEMRYVETIEQRIEWCKDTDKKNKLLYLLSSGPKPVIVFVNSKRGADLLGTTLEKSGVRAISLHGGKTQEAREYAIDAFRTNRYDVLVATDVAGRGLDVKGVKHVINYDAPQKIDEYQHRIGRTGRAGESGLATTMLTASDTAIMYDLRQYLIKSNQKVPSELEKNEAAQVKPGTIGEKPKRNQTLFLS